MDKYERKVRTDEINALIEEGELAQAAQIADTIDWKRERSTMMLCKISDVYKFNKRYEDSRDILLIAYERNPGGRLIVRSLCELSIKLGEFVQAVEYYKEFVRLAPKDNDKYVLLYKLYEAQDVSLEEKIKVLEDLKEQDYREKWAYELATLYHQVGLESKCVEECDEISIMIGGGRYVQKALELKMLHEPLTEEQNEKYELLKSGNYVAPDYAPDQQEEPEERHETEEEDEETSLEEKMLAVDTQEIPDPNEEMDIQVKTVDVSQYNTINLQRELAESMKDFLDTGNLPDTAASVPEEAEDLQVTRIFEPIGEDDVPVLRQDTDEIKPITEPQPKTVSTTGQEDSEEVFFGNTSEVNIQDMVSELKDQNGSKTPFTPIQEELGQISQEGSTAQASGKALSNTGIIHTFHKSSGYDEMLSQGYDGQISMVMPEEVKVEKQITGQLSIEDVMTEWEKIKQENERKRMEEIRKRVKQQTNTLFADFDESTKSGLLEELEKAMVTAASKDPKFGKPKVIKVADIEKQQMEEPVVEEDIEDIYEQDAEQEIEETAEDVQEMLKEAAEEEETIGEQEIEEETAEAAETEAEGAEEPAPKAEKETSGASEENTGEGQKAAVREMTAGEREQFAPFIHHKKTRRQIVEAIDNISMASYTGNVIISGEEGTGRIALAKLLVNEIQMSDNNFSGKVAKISGTTMNKKDVAATLGKLSNGALIIEGAASMKKNTVEQLKKELNQEEKGLIVLLEDDKTKIKDFLEKYPDITTEFNLRVDVEALDDQTLVKYAKKYALEQEYSIDDLGVLALHTRIADMQTSDHEVTLAEIEELVDEAIYYADRKTPKHFLDILVGKRYDEEDMIVLREKDFMHI